MVDRLATFCSILERSVAVYDALSALYAPDAALDWASRTLMQTASVRTSLASRLAKPDLDLEETSIVTIMVDKYLDGHWADYIDLPKHDSTKYNQVQQLHAALRSLMDEVTPINLELYNERRAQQSGAG